MRKLLLVGNPNVGKSVIFSRLTGVKVMASNYAGTTVAFSEGYTRDGKGEKMRLIDIPGLYSFDSQVVAENIAAKMVDDFNEEDGNIFINVIDSTNLERNLNLTLQLIEKKIPIVVVLNFWDEAKHTGVEIDVKKLSSILGVPVAPVCGVTGEGIKELVREIDMAAVSRLEFDPRNRWNTIGDIIKSTQILRHKHHSLFNILEDITIHPLWGLPISALILTLSFIVIRFIGEGLIGLFFEPLFDYLWTPFVFKVAEWIRPDSVFGNILFGQLGENTIDYVESLGLLTTGLFVPISMVLPYIIAFYLVLGIMEDTGYLPRLGVLVDQFMHRLGIHGLAIIPMLLGLGCNVPGAMATRVLETRRERFIASTLMAIAIPCMSQIAMIFGLLGPYGVWPIMIVFIVLFMVWILIGLVMNRFIKGESPEIFVEIPPYRIPYARVLYKKLKMRIFEFLKEAVPFVLVGVLIVNLLYEFHVIDFMGKTLTPLITGLFNLPADVVGALLIGFLRKDVAVGMLAPLDLSVDQMITASVVLTMYFPCIATFTVLVRELGVKDMFKSFLIMLISTLLVGFLLSRVLKWILTYV